MRLLTIVLAVGVAAGGCDRSGTKASDAAVPATTTATPGPGTPAQSGAALTSSQTPAPPASASAVAAPTAAAPAPAPTATAPAPVVREVTLPAGTQLPIVLETTISSEGSRVEEAVHAHTARPVVVHGETVLAEGTRLSGVVTNATRSGKVKGLAHISVRFDTLSPRGDDERYTIRTAAVERTAKSTKKKDAVKVGGGAAGGAILGALIGGKKGAAIGTAVGGGAGTAAVLSTRGNEVQLPKGSALTIRLSEPVTIRIRG